MAAKGKSDDSAFEQARRSFQDLNLQDRAVFLVEAAVSTLAKGLEDATETLSQEIDAILKGAATAGQREQDAATSEESPEETTAEAATGTPADHNGAEKSARSSTSSGKRKKGAS
jgi:hypothetical protein